MICIPCGLGHCPKPEAGWADQARESPGAELSDLRGDVCDQCELLRRWRAQRRSTDGHAIAWRMTCLCVSARGTGASAAQTMERVDRGCLRSTPGPVGLDACGAALDPVEA